MKINNETALKDLNSKVLVKSNKKYQELVDFVEQNSTNNINLFTKNNVLLDKYKNRTLEEIDLSNINFDDKNISGIDISKNKEVKINFDKIVKDLSNSNISGYDLNKYKFVGWNLTNTNLTNTKATIDLGSCNISYESKMSPGTLFDEDNKFVFNEKYLSVDEVRNLSIKVIKKIR